MKENTIKAYVHFSGDSSVGMFGFSFEIDTGLYEMEKQDKDFFVKEILQKYYDLHDYGTMDFDFSDEFDKRINDEWNHYSYAIKHDGIKGWKFD